MDDQNNIAQDANSPTIHAGKQQGPWLKLPPIALAYFALAVVKNFAGQLEMLIPLVFAGYSIAKNNITAFFVLSMLLMCITMVYSVLNFIAYRYRLSDQSIEIRSGVIQKSQINLPFERIQNIKLVQPIYYRWTGYCCMEFDTAGSAKNEASIVAIKLTSAQQFKQRIMTNAPTQKSADAAAPKSTDAERLLIKRKLYDLILHGLTNNRIWIFLGAAAPFYNGIGTYIASVLSRWGIDLSQINLKTQSDFSVTLTVLTLIVLILLLVALLSIISAIITHYDFTLEKVSARYVRRSGLFTKREVSMPLRRLQLTLYQQDWLDLVLKRVNIVFQQNANVGGEISNTNLSQKILVPSITYDEADLLIEDAMPNVNLRHNHYKHVSRRLIAKLWLQFWLPFSIMISVGTYLLAKSLLLSIIMLVCASLLGSLAAILSWYRWGYYEDAQYVCFRRGFLGRDFGCFLHYKVQQVQLHETWLMKRHKLCSLSFVLASQTIKVPYIPITAARKMINRSLGQVEHSGQSWM
ncbi:MAG: PH domain-containing protein [Porticoccaceae bacterium]|nr:PH domain-containing protein [Porticoccaceae bacterium]